MARLLIIDDEPRLAMPLAEMLRRQGHEADYAGGAGAALSAMKQARPDLILLDLSMPRVDGLDLLDAIREEPALADVPVAVYSGRNDPESIAQAERLGACEFIVKGPDWENIYARIKAHLPAPRTDA